MRNIDDNWVIVLLNEITEALRVTYILYNMFQVSLIGQSQSSKNGTQLQN